MRREDVVDQFVERCLVPVLLGGRWLGRSFQAGRFDVANQIRECRVALLCGLGQAFCTAAAGVDPLLLEDRPGLRASARKLPTRRIAASLD